MLQVLGELQDRLAPFSSAVAYALIEQELGQPVGAVFSALSPEPVAAASLGQVRAGCAAPAAPAGGMTRHPPVHFCCCA